ncbi:MAG TPA: aminopeptidase N, partial [Planctomycetes bacterium]|nr:aminopeptidase N [Planctomycetota bacterium]
MIETATKKEEPTPVYRKDYQPPNHWIERVDLTFQVNDGECLVGARMEIRRNGDVNPGDAPLELVGEELDLRGVSLDGRPLDAGAYRSSPDALVIPSPPDSFVLETQVAIHPESNTQLSGLYASSGNLCTQCEAEGFRRITYFLDRPDVMARYTVRIEADKERYPVLLSNGNRTGAGELEGGRHFVSWEDPFPKPSYLFALVAGKLECYRDSFTTMSGREIPLEIWVEPQNIDRCEHAMVSLKKAMKWDEDVFGLEIDLDLYMIFVADDFNMG